jgi:hypothetical protein
MVKHIRYSSYNIRKEYEGGLLQLGIKLCVTILTQSDKRPGVWIKFP